MNAARLRAALTEPDGEFEALVAAIHTTNSALWKHEDEVRRRDLPDAEIVRLKRAIDRLNLQRHAAIEAVDTWLDQHHPSRVQPDDAVLNSESVGQMTDRLSILELKLGAWAGTPRQAALEGRLELLLRCLDRVLAAVVEGCALPQRQDEAKTYSA